MQEEESLFFFFFFFIITNAFNKDDDLAAFHLNAILAAPGSKVKEKACIYFTYALLKQTSQFKPEI